MMYFTQQVTLELQLESYLLIEKKLLVINKFYPILRIMPSTAAILVLFGFITFLNLLAYHTPTACLAMAATPIVLPAAANSTRAGGGALAALNLLEVYELCLCSLLCGLVLLRQLNLDQHNHIELVVTVPLGVGYGLDGVRCLEGHCHSFGCARAPLLEVNLLGFPPVVPVHVGLDLVLVNGVCDLVERADLDVGVRVLAAHDGAKVLHREKEQVDGTAPPDGMAVLRQRREVSTLLGERAVDVKLDEGEVGQALRVE
jgi:hypothetical protein